MLLLLLFFLNLSRFIHCNVPSNQSTHLGSFVSRLVRTKLAAPSANSRKFRDASPIYRDFCFVSISDLSGLVLFYLFYSIFFLTADEPRERERAKKGP